MTTNEKTEKSELRSIPFKQIFVDPAENHTRTDLPKVKELAESMAEKGQLTPVLVENGGDAKQPYTLRAGYRRMAAFELNGWTNKEVLCRVRDYSGKDSEARRIADNWVENQQREGTRALDLADTVYALAQGTYRVEAGDTAVKYEHEKIGHFLEISRDMVRLYVRIASRLSPEARAVIKKNAVPLRRLGDWALIEDPEKQAAAAAEWLAHQAELAAEGRKRNPKAKKAKAAGGGGGGDEEGSGERKPAVRPDKKIDDDNHTPSDYLAMLLAKQAEVTSKEEQAYLQGLTNAFRFIQGDLKKIPGIRKEDWKLIAPDEEELDEEEGEE